MARMWCEIRICFFNCETQEDASTQAYSGMLRQDKKSECNERAPTSIVFGTEYFHLKCQKVIKPLTIHIKEKCVTSAHWVIRIPSGCHYILYTQEMLHIFARRTYPKHNGWSDCVRVCSAFVHSCRIYERIKYQMYINTHILQASEQTTTTLYYWKPSNHQSCIFWYFELSKIFINNITTRWSGKMNKLCAWPHRRL